MPISLPLIWRARALSTQDREEEKLCRAVKRLHTTSSNNDISTSSSEVCTAGVHLSCTPVDSHAPQILAEGTLALAESLVMKGG